MFSQIGMPEILVILLIVLLVFGAKRLPEMGAAMGKGIREFKKSISEVKESVDAGNENPPPTRRLDSAAVNEGGEPKKLSQ
jgi:sec-independent protein translocase protein TatA